VAGLKPFREIPRDLAEWTRWMSDQDVASTTTVVSSETTSNLHRVATLNLNAASFEYSVATSWEIDLEDATGNVTLTLSGGPAIGESGEMVIRVTQDGTARTITWAGGTFLWAGGTPPTLTATEDAIDVFTFQSVDEGNTWTGSALQNVS
jgi:hypothetical protein